MYVNMYTSGEKLGETQKNAVTSPMYAAGDHSENWGRDYFKLV
jgi:hypothetical protein